MGEPSAEIRKLMRTAEEIGATLEIVEIAHELGERHSIRNALVYPVSTWRVYAEVHATNEFGQRRYKQLQETGDTLTGCVERVCAILRTPIMRKG